MDDIMQSTNAIWRGNRARLDGTETAKKGAGKEGPKVKEMLILYEIETETHERFNFYKLDNVDQNDILNGQNADDLDQETIFDRVIARK